MRRKPNLVYKERTEPFCLCLVQKIKVDSRSMKVKNLKNDAYLHRALAGQTRQTPTEN